MTTSNAINALGQQLFNFAFDLAGLLWVHQAFGQRLSQPQTPVGGFEQDSATVGAALSGWSKLPDHRLGKYFGKQQTLCCAIVSQAKASFGFSSIVSTTCLYHRRLFVSLRNVNNPG